MHAFHSISILSFFTTFPCHSQLTSTSTMKIISFYIAALLLIPLAAFARDSAWLPSRFGYDSDNGKRRVTMEIATTSKAVGEEKKIEKEGSEIAGSRLPDCSHACGWCRPCRLVIVGSLCASLAQTAETCPVSYRCMCNHKCYPIP